MEWVKKNLNYSVKEKRQLIERANSEITINWQCELLGIFRSGFYYHGKKLSAFNLRLMKLIDEQYMHTPFYGVDKMTAWLNRQGHNVNKKRIRRLMRIIGIEAIYPKRRLSLSAQGNKKYPYLLRDIKIEKPEQVWCADIT